MNSAWWIKQKNESEKRCPECGRVLTQQFIDLKHCKCGLTWSKQAGYFQRTGDMVFALECKVIKKSKNSVKAKQVPVVRHKTTPESDSTEI